MQYLLNGGGHEIRSLSSPDVLAWIKEQGVKQILFVSFAMVEEYWQKQWETPQRHIDLPGITIDSLTMTNYSTEKATLALAMADAVMIPGGMPDVLVERLNNTGLGELLINAVSQDQIKFIGGASAGEMALGQTLIVGGGKGLNIITNHIFDAHFSSRKRLSRLQQAVDKTAATIGVGIDEDTTLILDQNFQPTRVFGPGSVTYYKHEQEPQTYDSNSTFPVQD